MASYPMSSVILKANNATIQHKEETADAKLSGPLLTMVGSQSEKKEWQKRAEQSFDLKEKEKAKG